VGTQALGQRYGIYDCSLRRIASVSSRSSAICSPTSESQHSIRVANSSRSSSHHPRAIATSFAFSADQIRPSLNRGTSQIPPPLTPGGGGSTSSIDRSCGGYSTRVGVQGPNVLKWTSADLGSMAYRSRVDNESLGRAVVRQALAKR
jgi:hypothetical protein